MARRREGCRVNMNKRSCTRVSSRDRRCARRPALAARLEVPLPTGRGVAKVDRDETAGAGEKNCNVAAATWTAFLVCCVAGFRRMETGSGTHRHLGPACLPAMRHKMNRGTEWLCADQTPNPGYCNVPPEPATGELILRWPEQPSAKRRTRAGAKSVHTWGRFKRSESVLIPTGR